MTHAEASHPRSLLALVCALSAFALAGCNDVAAPVDDALAKDSRNSSVDLQARYSGLFARDVLVLEIEAGPTAAPVDLFRALLQSAAALQDRTFESVELHSNSGHEFTMSGSYYSKIGQEYDWQNPVYTMRTFPYELSRPDGSRPYTNLGGGLFGVTEQMRDFSDAMAEWSDVGAP